MFLLITGILWFAFVHLSPALTPGIKAAVRQRTGDGGYRGLFSLLVAVGLVLIVLGWRSADPEFVYLPPAGLKHAAMGLVFLALLLMVTSSRPSRLRRVVRHPQLTGVIIWAVAHLLLNGDNRSLVLFGGLAIWAVLEIVLINRRDGEYVAPPAPGWGAELVNLAIAAVVVAVVVAVHPWISGMPVY